MVRASVLLTDDEEVFGQTTAELIRRNGYDCDVANCVDGAMAFLAQRRYDVLVADIMMPGNARLDLLHQARSGFPDMQIILVTGFPSVETAVQSLDNGVFAYKIKPFDFDDFMITLSQAVKRARLQQGVRHQAERGEARGDVGHGEAGGTGGQPLGSPCTTLSGQAGVLIGLANGETVCESLNLPDIFGRLSWRELIND